MLINKNFRLYFQSSLMSSLGNYISIFATTLFLLDLYNSALFMSAYLASV